MKTRTESNIYKQLGTHQSVSWKQTSGQSLLTRQLLGLCGNISWILHISTTYSAMILCKPAAASTHYNYVKQVRNVSPTENFDLCDFSYLWNEPKIWIMLIIYDTLLLDSPSFCYKLI
jgi:hypothetical protein